MNGQTAWQTPGHHQGNASRSFHHSDDGPPQDHSLIDASMGAAADAPDIDDDARRQRAHFMDLYRQSEARISSMFREDGSYNHDIKNHWDHSFRLAHSASPPPATDHEPIEERPAKRVKRVIDEDDYGDDESESEEDDAGGVAHHDDTHNASPLKHKSAATASKGLLSPTKSGSSPVPSVTSPDKATEKAKDASSQDSQSQQGRTKTSEETRKQLEDARKDTEEAAKRGFHTLFYTLENDRTAMLEQQKLEESEKQLQAEMDKNSATAPAEGSTVENHGSLSSANLGASSLTLKHLIARIDMKRDMVRASDAELRSLMNEVRKNRSKWASEENVNQEELYEALEKVLTELKAHTECSTPFLQRVNKREAPDYYNQIKQPMDLGSMTKKLKSLAYKSKQDFVADLNLIWDNCLRYNKNLSNGLQRMANGMRKEAEKLVPLIPDLTIRSRAEVEAEERRKQNGGDDDAGDDSDDEPIMSSRGRITGSTKGTKSRKAPTDHKEDTPGIDQKPVLPLNGLLVKAHREGSDLEGSNGFGSPAVGALTPNGLNGTVGTGSNVDAMDIDEPSLHGLALGQALTNAAQQVYEDEEYRIWKQITKKDRALVARERQQLFAGNKLNPDEPALLRTKAGMRRYLKSLQQAEALKDPLQSDPAAPAVQGAKAIETLAEGMEADEERVIPDYYEPQSLIPDIPPQLQWIEDGEGQVINSFGEYLHEVPQGYFSAPKHGLAQRFDANLRQMQETRKVCSKISVVKQMQLQTQVYANQFPKYNPEPFVEAETEPHVTSGDNLVMAPELCRAAMQRSVAKIFYHAGFEELQPSALDTITDIAADYFGKIVGSFNAFSQVEMKDPSLDYAKQGAKSQPRCSGEEIVLHTLAENGYSIEALESYAKDEVERLGNKLGIIHERMKAHLGDLLRPAMHDTNQEGTNFRDGSDQFLAGDFAEDIGEDFFGFKELGLAGELGGVLSVPLHLLQTRVRNQYQAQNPTAGEPTDEQLFEEPPPLEAVTKENIQGQISLIKNFFLAKLHANGDSPLVEDEDLPIKQRRPRPRLGATGKIVSPQKRPPKEQNAINKKKKKLEAQAAAANKSPEKAGAKDKKPTLVTAGSSGINGINLPTASGMERLESMQSHTDKDDTGMMSPESMER
ncbi:transcriptional activator SPT7 [Microdochium nivale]|nr:transcriptional activator SPT7 [Microdochium nivale]